MSRHVLLDKAFVFPRDKGPQDPEGCVYSREKGLWLREEEGQFVALVRSNDPNKPIAGTKKADIETGEDQKGE